MPEGVMAGLSAPHERCWGWPTRHLRCGHIIEWEPLPRRAIAYGDFSSSRPRVPSTSLGASSGPSRETNFRASRYFAFVPAAVACRSRADTRVKAADHQCFPHKRELAWIGRSAVVLEPAAEKSPRLFRGPDRRHACGG